METSIPSPGRIVFTGAGNGNGRDVLVRVGNNVRSGEALRDFHVVEFPFAYVVKVDIRADGLNLFDIRRNKVYIINRAEEDIVECRVVRGKFNGGYAGIRFYIDLTDNRGIIALLVANREFNGVNSVRENAVPQRTITPPLIVQATSTPSTYAFAVDSSSPVALSFTRSATIAPKEILLSVDSATFPLMKETASLILVDAQRTSLNTGASLSSTAEE